MNQKPRSVACPNCGKSVEWTAQNAFRPFCSERCKLIDLGRWFDERYRLPGEPSPAEKTGDDDPDE